MNITPSFNYPYFDIIGDVHGQHTKLVGLLTKLGYQLRNGFWQHPERMVLFVGDLFDRGPQQFETFQTVRAMHEAGTALVVMGNHELNAMNWFFSHPQRPGDSLRTRHGAKGKRHRQQHQQFLSEMHGKPAWYAAMQWCLKLPLWIELPDLGLVHACWDTQAMEILRNSDIRDSKGCLTEDFLVQTVTEGTPIHQAVSSLLSGPEVDLPAGYSFVDPDGSTRIRSRIRWWHQAANFGDAILGDTGLGQQLANLPAPATTLLQLPEKPIFFGHYWFTGTPQILTPHITCVDYSAGIDGPLVAYRYSGEKTLSNAHWVY